MIKLTQQILHPDAVLGTNLLMAKKITNAKYTFPSNLPYTSAFEP